MLHFEHSFLTDSPLIEVARFHADMHELKRLTPPPIFVHLHKVDPLKNGAIADFTLWMGPLPVRWVARHTDVEPERGFTDTQLKGPFKIWVHKHEFKQVNETSTEIRDTIDAELASHPLWRVVGLLMWVNLPVLFAFRAWVTRRNTQKRRNETASNFIG